MSFCVEFVRVFLCGACTCLSVWRLYVSFCVEHVRVFLCGVCTCLSVWSMYMSFCVEFVHVVFTRMPSKSYCRRFKSLLLQPRGVFRSLINSLVG